MIVSPYTMACSPGKPLDEGVLSTNMEKRLPNNGQSLFTQPKNGSQAFAQVAFLIVIAISILMAAPWE